MCDVLFLKDAVAVEGHMIMTEASIRAAGADMEMVHTTAMEVIVVSNAFCQALYFCLYIMYLWDSVSLCCRLWRWPRWTWRI